MQKRYKDIDDFVAQHLAELRAPLSMRTTFGYGGRSIGADEGERMILGPDGHPIRILENPWGGTQVTTDESQHVMVRPQTIRKGAKAS